MKSIKDRLRGRSLKSLGKRVLRRTSDDRDGDDNPINILESLRESNGDLSQDQQSSLSVAERRVDANWIDIEMMGDWLRDCDDKHGGACRKPFGLDPKSLGRPNWLIDVQKMCIVTAEPSHRYACLSYVWGNVATLKTEKASLDGLMEEKALESHREEIPRTIRDAIDLCAQLGIPYLWVDALCIVQDDQAAKHDQIQGMAGIYANAYVTLIAGNGWDANHGLRGLQGITESRHLCSSWKSGFQPVQPYSGIWYSRGWTFQEMVFSPRKIMFQYQLATWECNEASWHEFPLSEPSIPTWLQESVNPWRSRILFSEYPDIEQYVAMVRDYTNRKFSYPEDSLHAITSLLSVMSSSFPRGFVTGLPEMCFNEAMLWQPGEPMQRRRGSKMASSVPPADASSVASTDESSAHSVDASILPSWSWVGWEGEMEKKSWLQNWTHLRLLDPPEPGYQNQSQTDMFQVIPTVKWFCGNDLQERIPIHASYDTHLDCRNSNKLRPPMRNWSSDGRWYVYKANQSAWSSYPIPVTSSPTPRVISARYLFCRTKRGVFKWKPQTGYGDYKSRTVLFARIEHRDGHWIGSMNLNLNLTTYQLPRKFIECELVIISAGAMNPRDFVKQTPRWFNKLPNTAHSHDDFEYYNILWIEWKDGIAYRKALGRITKDGWDSEITEEIDLVLG